MFKALKFIWSFIKWSVSSVGILVTSLVLFSVLTYNTSRVKPIQKATNLSPVGLFTKSPKYNNPIAKIYMLEGGTKVRSCSGTVIDSRYLLTAAHCVYDRSYGLREESYEILVIDRPDPIIGRAVAMNIKTDVALIEGDFSEVKPAIIDTKHFLDDDKDATACGYPLNSSSLVCSHITNLRMAVGFYAGKGSLMYGMSGGPLVQEREVIIYTPDGPRLEKRDVVVGVNSHFTDNYDYAVAFGSTIALFESMGIETNE